tara:strand:- start:188 stop:778 length:591 start_codon:yes stop_codon:yes gene_type:complete
MSSPAGGGKYEAAAKINQKIAMHKELKAVLGKFVQRKNFRKAKAKLKKRIREANKLKEAEAWAEGLKIIDEIDDLNKLGEYLAAREYDFDDQISENERAYSVVNDILLEWDRKKKKGNKDIGSYLQKMKGDSKEKRLFKKFQAKYKKKQISPPDFKLAMKILQIMSDLGTYDQTGQLKKNLNKFQPFEELSVELKF